VTDWDPEPLWDKTRLFAARASTVEQEGSLFPFWSILALELLGRAVLANVHPTLLADPQSPDNLLYACGLGQVRKPKSVPATTVFSRCVKVVDDFTEADMKSSLGLVDLRNSELHSGATPFEGLRTAAWLAEYYRLCNLLLAPLGKSLRDLFGEEQGQAAETMISGAAEQLVAEVNEYVASVRRAFRVLATQEMADRRETGAQWIKEMRAAAYTPSAMGRVISCPACASEAWVGGELVRLAEPVAEEDAIVQEVVKIPTDLECRVCGLALAGHGRLHAIGLGGLFTGQLAEDPVSYFQIEFDPAEYYEPDYGNE
jgi:hypothetical protein